MNEVYDTSVTRITLSKNKRTKLWTRDYIVTTLVINETYYTDILIWSVTTVMAHFLVYSNLDAWLSVKLLTYSGKKQKPISAGWLWWVDDCLTVWWKVNNTWYCLLTSFYFPFLSVPSFTLNQDLVLVFIIFTISTNIIIINTLTGFQVKSGMNSGQYNKTETVNQQQLHICNHWELTLCYKHQMTRQEKRHEIKCKSVSDVWIPLEVFEYNRLQNKNRSVNTWKYAVVRYEIPMKYE